MYLQSVELFGFKSFAHKTTLNFHRGVTAIVGPNGCGKSNVLDAMRWVLGEQSAKALRGGEMADVIFSGTDTKQPVGMAEVSLKFADCEKELGIEYNEVCITRRVYRDGRSDYFINQTPCRLKDIQMLFMDTGVGRTAYSIMEQGRIDQILSSRPEDRRSIFEEAAGITKYKAQKKEALRKLEYTDANLLRLADIIKEVKRQIGSLQRQAGKARRYQTLFDEVRVLDLHLCSQQRGEFTAGLDAAETAIEELQLRQRSLEEQSESLEFGLTEQREELERLEEQVLGARQVVQDLKSQVDSAHHRIGFNSERIEEARQLCDRYEKDAAIAEEKLQQQQTQIAETDEQLEVIQQSLRAEEERLRDEQARVSEFRSRRGERERAAQELQRRTQQLESRAAGLRGDLSSSVNAREAGQTRLQLLEEEWAAAEARSTALAVQLEEAQSQQEKNQSLLESCRQAVRDAEHDAAARQKELQQLDRELSKTQRSLAERESKHEALGQLNEEGAGLGPGTQAVLKGLDNPQLFRPTILGALANLIEVDKEFLPSIEAALGEQLQTVLIGDETVAEALGQALVAGGFGRAALVARSAYQSFSGVQMEATPFGALCWALDRIRVRPEAVQFVHRALAKVVLASDLQTAIEIKRANRDLAVATLGGEFISEGGVITAGKAAGNRNSVLERKLQIRALQSECETLRRSLQELESEKQALQTELDEAQRRLTEARETVQRAQVSVSTQLNAIGLLERELHELEGKTKSLAFERGNTEQRVRSAVDREQSLVAELETKTTELNSLQEEHASALAEIDGLRSQEEQFNDELNDLKVRVATERQRSENLQRQRQPMANRLNELQDFVQARQADIRAYAAKIQQWEKEIASLREKLVELENEKVAAEQAVGRLLEERSARVNAVEAVENSLRQLRHQLGESQKARGEKEVLSTQLKLRLESLQEHASRRYQTDLTLFEADWHGFRILCRRLLADRLESANKNSWDPDFPSSLENWEHVKTLVTEMNDRLDGMGPVNLEAIQEYDELEERQRFLDEQNADLVRSKAELLDVINKINATTQQLFADTFEQVRQNFQEMFTELFDGGKANLLLVDDTDPLESGIEIIAKPPGKQLQSITLLSGGEKTMTAVALLFAIYMVKPSPFCVLDEMDAPLDESNINRFIKILDRFVGQSQFVVITHNKRTIAKADVLYGVTMEEYGISKLVGVKLTKRDEQEDLLAAEAATAP